MKEDKKNIKTSTVKETKDYIHEDIEGVDIEEVDMESFKTVNIPNGNKIVIARNKKSGELQAVRFLIAKPKEKKV